MNRIYKVVFNKTLGAYTAVSELASFKGKKSIKAALAVGLAGLMTVGSVSAAGITGGTAGDPISESNYSYTGNDSNGKSYKDGGYTASGGDVTADAYTENRDIYGGFAYGTAANAVLAADGNKVTAENGTNIGTDHKIYGGYVTAHKDATIGSATANDNTVSVTDSYASNIYGGHIEAFDNINSETVKVGGNLSANNNSVTVTMTSRNTDAMSLSGGLVALYDKVEGKDINVTVDENTVSGSNVKSSTKGGFLFTSTTVNNVSVSGNKVTLKQAEMNSSTADAIGGSIQVGKATGDVKVSDNQVTYTGLTKIDPVKDKEKIFVPDGFFAGAYGNVEEAKSLTVSDNSVSVENQVAEYIAGARVGTGVSKASYGEIKVTGNSATVKNSFAVRVAGANFYTETDHAGATISDNKATVTDSIVGDGVYGAYATGKNLQVTGNTAKVTGSTVQDYNSVYGAAVEGKNATMSGNTVAMDKSNADQVAGAYVKGDGATLTGNTANVTDSVFYQAMAADVEGDNATVSGNTANVTRSAGVAAMGVRVTGDNATVSGNTLNMTNVSVDVVGTYVNGDGAKLTGNTTNVTDSTVDYADGADVSGNNATVSGNTVNVGGDTVVSGLAGAEADGENNVLTKNTVNISGNTRFEDDGRGAKVYAARAWSETDESSNTVSDNTVNVTDNVKLENVDMYGRLKDNKGSGNTLNLNKWKGEIKSVNYFDNVNVNTSSAAKEQVVIGDLAKGNADTKITVNMDSQAARELNPADGTIAGGVREASKIVKLEKVDGSSEHDETIHVNMAEGDLVGNISADVTESGRISGLVEKENSIISSLRMIGANNFLVFRQQMNDLEKRMGDLRTMPQSDGAWARVVAGQAEYKGLHSTYKTVQAGADKRIGQFVIGATASYTDADGTMKRLGTDDKNYTYGIYGSWLGDNGHFVDVIVKRHHVASEFDARYADGRKVDGSTHTSGTSLSVEYGKRFGITNTNFYVEPQVEVMWGKLDSDSYKLSNGVKVSQDSIDSFIGRLGVATGWVSPEKKGSAYIKASVLNDWEADADMKAKSGAVVKKFHEDMGGTWGEFVIGGTYNFSKNFSAYGEIETSAGNPTKTTYQASAGIRYSF